MNAKIDLKQIIEPCKTFRRKHMRKPYDVGIGKDFLNRKKKNKP